MNNAPRHALGVTQASPANLWRHFGRAATGSS